MINLKERGLLIIKWKEAMKGEKPLSPSVSRAASYRWEGSEHNTEGKVDEVTQFSNCSTTVYEGGWVMSRALMMQY